MLDWRNIDFVLLDMDGTLLDLHFDNYFWQHYLPKAYAARHGLGYTEATEMLITRFNASRGTLDWYCLDYWAAELQLDIVSLKLDIQDRIAVRPGVHDFLGFLRQSGKQTVLLTNAHPKSLALKMQVTGLAGYLDQLVSTHTLGFPKESAGLWEALERLQGIDPGRCLFVDDTDAILERARKAGVRHILGIYQPDSQLPPLPEGPYPRIRHFAELHQGLS